jgi:hypothetical protein
MASLALTDGKRTGVYRVIKAAFEADTTLPAAGVRLVWLDGDDAAVRDLDPEGAILRFVPTLGPVRWSDEASIEGALIVRVQGVIPGNDVEDAMNLQDAIEGVINTIPRPDMQHDLTDAGALTGLILFTQPLTVANAATAGSDGLLRLQGAFAVDYQRTFA